MDDAIALSDCLAQTASALANGRHDTAGGRAPAAVSKGALLSATRRIGRIAAELGEEQLGSARSSVFALEHGAFARFYLRGFVLCAADGRHAAFFHSDHGACATPPAPDLSRLRLRVAGEPERRVMVSARR